MDEGPGLATGDVVWIAESDDAAHPRFLERLVPEFYDPEVVLGVLPVGPGRTRRRAAGRRLPRSYRRHIPQLEPAQPLFGTRGLRKPS